ncbi:hypothetical protein [Dactylosporangium sp. NPDC048998]|uniref:hypothetical protein n=1 Tax=Dactylosporangium sp. NPDC048998 TaxID=3363976 RepID=UPI00371D5777
MRRSDARPGQVRGARHLPRAESWSGGGDWVLVGGGTSVMACCIEVRARFDERGLGVGYPRAGGGQKSTT